MRFKKTAAVLAALVLAISGSLAVSTPAEAKVAVESIPPKPTKNDKAYKATARDKSARKGSPSAFSVFACPCFNYVVARQIFAAGGPTADGLAANLPVENTFLKTTAPAEHHTLAQLHVKSPGGEEIEYGITVDQSLFGDTQPRLFAGYRKNGVWQGYGVGFVDYAANTTNTYGTNVAVVPGTQRRFEIKYSAGNWWLAYDGGWIGYFPVSLFAPDTFINGQTFQAWMEVAAPNAQSCSDMGNGLPASNGSASRLGSINLTGLVPAGTAISFTGSVEPAGALGYTVTGLSATTFRGGGPGANAALTGVGTTGSC